MYKELHAETKKLIQKDTCMKFYCIKELPFFENDTSRIAFG